MNAKIDEQAILKSVFGFSTFRGKQEEVIRCVLGGNDVLAIMPTGAGKSLCYQLPALMLPGLTVVISPLIALMKDQVDGLQAMGIEAASLSSALDYREKNKVLQAIEEDQLKILYLSPERLFSSKPSFLDVLKKCQVSLFAIDEAHCISHWGHDFREDYLGLVQLKKEFPKVPIIAMTATADEPTRKDIQEQLFSGKSKTFITSFDRPNLKYMVEVRQHLFHQLDTFLSARTNQSGIIYCLSRKETENISAELIDMGYSRTAAYHAGLDKQIRTQRQEDFKHDKIQIMVATIAFGMGVDKPNVRFVIHTHLPKNIESFYQETGRAGRDGLPSDTLLLYSRGDASRLRFFILQGEDTAHQNLMFNKLNKMVAYTELNQCRRKLLLNYFDENHEGNCGNCDVCLSKLDRKIPVLSAKSEVKQKPAASDADLEKLRENLKEWRKSKALEEAVPAYIIFNDATLEALINQRPKVISKLEEIPGLGQVKIEKYGFELVKIIKQTWSKEAEEKALDQMKKGIKSANAHRSYSLFKRGYTPDEIAEQCGYAASTIYKHLEYFIYSGDLRLEELLPDGRIQLIQQAINQEGMIFLASIKEALPDEIDYREIGLVRARALRKKYQERVNSFWDDF